MPAVSASAPGKIILFGEHAAVYGQPAIAAPVHQVQARAVVQANPLAPPCAIQIDAPDIELHAALDTLDGNDPLVIAIEGVRQMLGYDRLPALKIHIHATIPVAAGLGSGAAVSVALIRALAAFLGHSLSNEQVSALAYQVEKRHHGTPSGIDNTVVTYARPVYFVRGQPHELLHIARPFTLVIADTGVKSTTREVVSGVRQRWQADATAYEQRFAAIGQIVQQARRIIEERDPHGLGPLMDENHRLLQDMGVSCPELDALTCAARQAGALGAKLSGAGGGGNLIALAADEQAQQIAAALQQAGATRTIITHLQPTQE